MHSGPAIVLTGKGYKEYHWLVIPHQPLQLSPLPTFSSKCLLLLVLSLAPSTTSVSAVPLFTFVVKLAIAPMPVGLLLLLCLMRRSIE